MCGGWGVGVGGEGNSNNKVGSASNCREDENKFLSPCRKMSLSAGCFLKSRLISSVGTVGFI